MYLNTIYLGEQCYGVQTAARMYFHKDVKDLTLAECACLIGITNNPPCMILCSATGPVRTTGSGS